MFLYAKKMHREMWDYPMWDLASLFVYSISYAMKSLYINTDKSIDDRNKLKGLTLKVWNAQENSDLNTDLKVAKVGAHLSSSSCWFQLNVEKQLNVASSGLDLTLDNICWPVPEELSHQLGLCSSGISEIYLGQSHRDIYKQAAALTIISVPCFRFPIIYAWPKTSKTAGT